MSRQRRLTATHGGLLIVDLQEKLVGAIAEGLEVVRNARRLVQGANLLRIPVWATEQYPAGLGSTVAALLPLLPHRSEKTGFSCCVLPELIEQLHGRGIRHVAVAGAEAHVCVAQTALDLMEMGFEVQVAADAVGSRNPRDRDFALRRLETSGATISTTEAILFEWLETADHPAFKGVSALVKNTGE